MNLPSVLATQKFYKLSDVDKLYKQLMDAYQALGLGADLALTDSQAHKLLVYLDNLLLWNKAYNLTAIKSPKEALIKHIVDCLSIVPDFDCHHSSIKTVLDIGTGAGLPAVILAIVRPEYEVVALDSNGKKIRFIRQMIAELDLPNLSAVASRIEDFSGQFDVITSRAFASLVDFVNLGAPYLADEPKGVFVAMKGRTPAADELDWLTAHGWRYDVKRLLVPDLSDERCLVYVYQ